ncbi:MAG TPA: MlaD family protein [Thermoleophilaceae bacterium]|nr:MlaD family protein [Thermoleophilaceae bacterium]
MRRGGAASLAGSPVLVGSVTVLITIVAVFLSYNANNGLPFVPTYDLRANLPSAAQLVRGNDVRIGGARVGSVSTISAQRRSDGSVYAQLHLKLDKSVEPLPADSTMLVRPRSSLGLKYLQIVPGKSHRNFAPGSTIPIVRATPKNVELDDVLNMFDVRTRKGARNSLQGLGTGFAGRGPSLNTAIAEFRPLLDDLQPVAANLASPRTHLGRFFRALGATASETSPVAGEQASLFTNMDVTFTALAGVARPFLQQSISESPPTEDVATREFPRQRPFIRNSTAFFRELRPGVATLPSSAPVLADALETGTATLPKTPPLNRRLADVFDSVQALNDDPLAVRGIKQLSRLAVSLKPTLAFLTPAQVRCNYGTLWFRNVSDLLSEGDTNGTWQRFIIIAAPQGKNSEGGPSSAPANGPEPNNYLHSNPYPNAAAPGETQECEAGNEPFLRGRKVIGNVPGNQGLKTDGQR